MGIQIIWSINFEFGSSPVSPLGIIADSVVGLIAEPVGKGPILPLLLGQPLLHE